MLAKIMMFLTVSVAVAFAAKAPKTAAEYYSDAAFQYIENRLPTAEITCKEGLSYYPDDAKLQMLADRIDESKNEQKNQNKENNPNGEKNQDKNQDQNQNQEQNQNQQNSENGSGNSSSSDQNNSSNSENSSDSQNDNSENSSENSSQSNGNSSNSNNSNNSNSQSDNAEGSSNSENSSDSRGGEEPPNEPGQMSPQEASQLLKDFDEEHGERKPWKPARGKARPEKDW